MYNESGRDAEISGPPPEFIGRARACRRLACLAFVLLPETRTRGRRINEDRCCGGLCGLCSLSLSLSTSNYARACTRLYIYRCMYTQCVHAYKVRGGAVQVCVSRPGNLASRARVCMLGRENKLRLKFPLSE